MMASAVLLGLGILDNRLAWVVVCFTLAMGALGACEAPFWVTGVELGGRRGGLSAAVLNAGGNVGGMLGPLLTPVISKFFGWQASLGVAGVVCAIGAALWWWIHPAARRTAADPAPATVVEGADQFP
jgi:dipeptide/tripeptide permease